MGAPTSLPNNTGYLDLLHLHITITMYDLLLKVKLIFKMTMELPPGCSASIIPEDENQWGKGIYGINQC